MKKEHKSKLFVVSAPSGAGKTTLAEKLLTSTPGIVRSVSMTTRTPRKGERRGRDYFFSSKTRFMIIKKKNGFLETAKVFDHYYGTPKSFVEKMLKHDLDVLLLIDVQGAMQIKRRMKNAVLIFVLPPSVKELERRLKNRSTETKTEINKRLKGSKKEMAMAKSYDYQVVNKRVDKAVEELRSIIVAEHLRVKK